MRFFIDATLMVVVVVGSLAGCEQPECGPDATCLSPELHIDACRIDPTGQTKLAGEFIGGVEDCSLDFGVITSAADREVRLTNASKIDVAVEVVLEAPIGPAVIAFSLPDEPPRTIPPGQHVNVTVHAIPLETGSTSTRLVVVSDAANLPPAAEGAIEVEIFGAVRAAR